MRIAISGTHCSGKSTLIEAFLALHPEYEHEPEPYEVLQDLHGELFSSEPGSEEFLLQLEYQLQRLQQYSKHSNVVFERSPFDFVAYIRALSVLGRDPAGKKVADLAMTKCYEAGTLLDLIVYLPLDDFNEEFSEEEDWELRTKMDDQLKELLIERIESPAVIEVNGSTERRLRILNEALQHN